MNVAQSKVVFLQTSIFSSTVGFFHFLVLVFVTFDVFLLLALVLATFGFFPLLALILATSSLFPFLPLELAMVGAHFGAMEVDLGLRDFGKLKLKGKEEGKVEGFKWVAHIG